MSQMSQTARQVSMPQTSASAIVVGERANLLAQAREGEREADRGDGDDANDQHEGLQRAEIKRPQVHAREHILPDPTNLTAGEELDGVADHHGEPDSDQEELQRAGARAPHRLPDDAIGLDAGIAASSASIFSAAALLSANMAQIAAKESSTSGAIALRRHQEPTDGRVGEFPAANGSAAGRPP